LQLENFIVREIRTTATYFELLIIYFPFNRVLILRRQVFDKIFVESFLKSTFVLMIDHELITFHTLAI
jgi:hypothetical protein